MRPPHFRKLSIIVGVVQHPIAMVLHLLIGNAILPIKHQDLAESIVMMIGVWPVTAQFGALPLYFNFKMYKISFEKAAEKSTSRKLASFCSFFVFGLGVVYQFVCFRAAMSDAMGGVAYLFLGIALSVIPIIVLFINSVVLKSCLFQHNCN